MLLSVDDSPTPRLKSPRYPIIGKVFAVNNIARCYPPFVNMNFARQIYDDAKKLFPDGTVEALVFRPSGASPGTSETRVRLVHKPTGIEIVCDDFPTQIENYTAAAIRLRIACDSCDA